MGMIVGYIISWTMVVQQELFANMPIQFYVPLVETVLITIFSLVCAWISIKGPIKSIAD